MAEGRQGGEAEAPVASEAAEGRDGAPAHGVIDNPRAGVVASTQGTYVISAVAVDHREERRDGVVSEMDDLCAGLVADAEPMSSQLDAHPDIFTIAAEPLVEAADLKGMSPSQAAAGADKEGGIRLFLSTLGLTPEECAPAVRHRIALNLQDQAAHRSQPGVFIPLAELVHKIGVGHRVRVDEDHDFAPGKFKAAIPRRGQAEVMGVTMHAETAGAGQRRALIRRAVIDQ